MKLYPPIYPSDSLLSPGSLPGGDAPSAWDRAVSRSERSTVTEQAVTPIDAAALERGARAARGVWLGSKLKAFYVALARNFERGGQAEFENFLAASQSLAELEERIRRYERRNTQDI